MYKLFCSDIDGTLLNQERSLSDATVSALAKAQLPIVLASSRMPSAMHYLQDLLSISDQPLIAYNGGLILGSQQKLLQSHTFGLDVLKAVMAHHQDSSYNLSIYSHDHWFTDREDYWSLREINNTRVKPTYQPATESLQFLKEKAKNIHKLMCMGEAKQIDSLVAYLQPKYETVVHLYRSKDTYLEITPKHIDKAKALEVVLETYFDFGMDSVMAFGDNHNDEALLREVGFGVAVGNATHRLKAIANFVSSVSHKEDAVAKAILQWTV